MRKNQKMEEYADITKKALLKIENETLSYDSQFAALGKREMDFDFILDAAISTSVQLSRGDETIKGLLLKKDKIKQLYKMYTGKDIASDTEYHRFFQDIHNFFRAMDYEFKCIIRDNKGKDHTVEGTCPVFGAIFEYDEDDAMLATFAPGGEQVFFKSLPTAPLTQIEMRSFIRLNRTFSKILYRKLLEHPTGWNPDINEVKRVFGLDTPNKQRNFFLRLDEYVQEVQDTGHLGAILATVRRKNSQSNRSQILGIDFKVTQQAKK